MRIPGRRHGRRGIGTVLATIVFVFIVIFMTGNLIVWGIVQSSNLQSVFNQMSQRDQQQSSEKVTVPSALFGGTYKYINCVVGTGCTNPTLTSNPGTATTPLVSNENFSTGTAGWLFTKILAPGTSSGISGGFDAGGSENGAVGSPSGPGMVYMGVSFFPPSGTATYSATWSNKFFVNLAQYGIANGKDLTDPAKCSGPQCAVVGSWAWILPRVNPGVISLTVKFEIADSSSSGTSCSAPHCYPIDQITYTTLADQTWNYRKSAWGGFATTGTAVATFASTGVNVAGNPWTPNQWQNYFVTITSGTGAGQSRIITTSTSNSLTVDIPWTTTPDATSQFSISLTDSGTYSGPPSTCATPCATLTDTNQKWDVNEWKNYYVSITAGTGTGQTRIVTSNTVTVLTLNSAWATPPDTTSQYVLGCPSNNFCDFDILSNTLLNQIPTTYTPSFWGVSGSPNYYTVQVEADFTLSQSTNPAEVRVIFDDVGLEFKTPSNFASAGGGGTAGTVIDLPLTNGENIGLIQQLTVSTATAFSIANVQEASYIKDYATGSFDPLASGFVSLQTVNTTNIFTGTDVQKYVGTLTAQGLLSRPAAAVLDGGGNLWVSDQHNNRVLEYTAASLASNGPPANMVIGQTSYSTSTSATSATGLNSPGGILFDGSGDLWVVDTGNNRILEYVKGTSPCGGGQFCTGMPASLVIGQATLTASSSATTNSGLTGPSGITFDGSGNLWVADTGNNRVLEFLKGGVFSSGETANMVIGQQSFTVSSPAPDGGQVTTVCGAGCATLTDNTKSWTPSQWVNGIVAITSGTGSGQSRIVVSNTAKVLTVSSAWTTQPDLTSIYAISPSTTTSSNTNAPLSLAFSGTNLWVMDTGSNRILEFVPGTAPCGGGLLCSGMPALHELGQPSGSTAFTTSGSATTASGLSGPTGLALDSGGNIWVGDTGNNRVLMFPIGGFLDGESANLVIGQSSFATNTAATTQNGMNSPADIFFDVPGKLWVADRTNSRILQFAPAFATGMNAAFEAGQPSGAGAYTTAAHPNVEVLISATSPLSFNANTVAVSVQDFFKDPNHVTIQVANGWASTSHLVDVFISDSGGIHCFSRLVVGCSVGGGTWGGIYIAPGTTGVVVLTYTWNTGPVTIKVTTDLGNTVVLNTIAS